MEWARQSGALGAGEADELVSAVAEDPRQGEAGFARAIAFREALYRLFSTLARGEARLGADDLELLNSVLREALAHLEVDATPEGFDWTWRSGDLDSDRILWPVARSAAELLTSDEVPQLRECASETCGWLFVDRSRTRRRKWCDMSTCGNRAKARRYYRRRKADRTGSA